MGHPSYKAITYLPKVVKGVIVKGPIPEGLNLEDSKLEDLNMEDQICEICTLLKASRKISRRSSERATKAFEQLHFDLILFNEAYNNHKWAIHFLCDATRIHFLYTMMYKSDALEKIKYICAFAKNQWNQRVKILHSDREPSLGNEYIQWTDEEGILIKQTAPYTPDQNGATERHGGVIVSRA